MTAHTHSLWCENLNREAKKEKKKNPHTMIYSGKENNYGPCYMTTPNRHGSEILQHLTLSGRWQESYVSLDNHGKTFH